MSNVVIVRIDLDTYDLQELTRLIETGVVTISEARTAHDVLILSDLQQLKLVRQWQALLQMVRMAG